MSSEELRQLYLNNLETLLSAPRLLRQRSFDVETDGIPDDLSSDGGAYSGGWYGFGGDAFKEAIRANCDAVAAQTGPLLTERYCVSGSRDELLAYLDTAKDSVKRRLNGEARDGLSFTEFTYQLLQGYDFLHLYETKGCKLQLVW